LQNADGFASGLQCWPPGRETTAPEWLDRLPALDEDAVSCPGLITSVICTPVTWPFLAGFCFLSAVELAVRVGFALVALAISCSAVFEGHPRVQ
jgi:hypothetical protein